MRGQYRLQLKFQPLPTSKLNAKATMNRPINAGIITPISNRLFAARKRLYAPLNAPKAGSRMKSAHQFSSKDNTPIWLSRTTAPAPIKMRPSQMLDDGTLFMLFDLFFPLLILLLYRRQSLYPTRFARGSFVKVTATYIFILCFSPLLTNVKQV